jgi:hypothetical protein
MLEAKAGAMKVIVASKVRDSLYMGILFRAKEMEGRSSLILTEKGLVSQK